MERGGWGKKYNTQRGDTWLRCSAKKMSRPLGEMCKGLPVGGRLANHWQFKGGVERYITWSI